MNAYLSAMQLSCVYDYPYFRQQLTVQILGVTEGYNFD
jgi:hypothetical protein